MEEEEEEEIKSEKIEVKNEVEINKQASPQVLAKKIQNEIDSLDFLPYHPFPNKVAKSKREKQKMMSMGENMSIVIQRKFPNTCKKLDFYILEIHFLKTSKLEVDINDGTISMEMDGEAPIFNIFKAMNYPIINDSIFSINLFDFSMLDVLESNGKFELNVNFRVQDSKRV